MNKTISDLIIGVYNQVFSLLDEFRIGAKVI